MTSLFLDTSFAIALAAPTDQNHRKARELASHLELEGIRMITTQAVLLEIGNALAKPRYRQAAVQLLSALESDAQVEVVPLSDTLYQRGFELYRARPEKEWGLIDGISFEVMWDRGLADSLTTDRHFEQAGFRALLRSARA